MGIRTDLLVTEEIVDSSVLRASPFEFERAKRVEAALSILEGKWKIGFSEPALRAPYLAILGTDLAFDEDVLLSSRQFTPWVAGP